MKFDYSKLTGENEAKIIFSSIEKSYPNNHDIETIKFLYQNIHYNKNRFLNEMYRGEGFKFNKEVSKIFKGKKFIMKLPFTIWADILFFELNSFLANVIRILSYITSFKLKNFDNIKLDSQITIGRYLHKKNYKKYCDTLMYDFFKIEWDKWAFHINDLRNEVIHGDIIRQANMFLGVEVRFKEEGIVSNEKKTLGIPKYKIDDLEKFVNKTINNLDNFIINLFKLL